MGSTSDRVTGRVKEAAGDLTGDRDLQAEGKLDQVGADIKEAAEKVKDTVSEKVDALKDRLSN